MGNSKFPWLYLLLAYGLTWIFWVPVAMTGQDYQSSAYLLILVFAGVAGPGVAGIILTYAEKGREGGRDFWRRASDFKRIRAPWYIGIILLWPLLHLTAKAINWLLGGTPTDSEFVRQLVSEPMGIPVVILLYLLQAALEELGWRGYMQDRVQAILDLATTSIVIGVCHALWHLPTFWIVGTNQAEWGFGVDFFIFIGFVISTAVYSTWCYNGNGRSTLAVILLHGVANLSIDIFSVPGQQQRIFSLLAMLGAAVILILWRVRRRSQGQGEGKDILERLTTGNRF